jgi:hypothetical protein
MMNNISLQVIQDNKVIFESHKHWLIPLFDFEDHLRSHPAEPSTLEVHDKVIGKAAALLIVRLGAGSVHGDVMSELALEVLQQADIAHTYTKLVKRIECKTEEILLEINDPEEAYQILCKRAQRC